MDDVLPRNDLRDEVTEQKRKYKNTTGRNNKRCFRLSIKYIRFFNSNNSCIAHSPQPLNVTPELTQAAISQKPEKESLAPPLPWNPAFLTSPPTLETPSQQGPKRKRRRIQILSYLDDHNAYAKQLRKRSRHKKFRIKSYKYSMGEEDED